MTGNQYQVLAMRTENKALSDKEHLLNGLMGLCGESGEALDLLKKHLFQGHDFNVDHVVKELGDAMWYMAQTASALGLWLDDIMEINLQKLGNRYEDGFTVEESLHRKAGDV